MLQVQVHCGVQVDVGHVQELRVEDARPGRRHGVECRGRAGRSQVQPFHGLPWRFRECHPEALAVGRDGRHLGGHRRQRGVHHVAVAEHLVIVVGADEAAVDGLLRRALVAADLEQDDVALPTHGTAQQCLKVAVPMAHSVLEGHLGGRHVAIVSMELGHGDATGTAR